MHAGSVADMIPYAEFLYFNVLLVFVVVPTLAVRVVGGFSRRWIIAATLFMLVIQYGGLFDPPESLAALSKVLGPRHVQELWMLAGLAFYEWVLAASFLLSRSRKQSRSMFYAAVVLALLPLAAAKVLPLWTPGAAWGFLGLSYFTFRALDVVFSIQDRVIVSLPAGQYLAYLVFFPTISSGPIDRYRRFAQDWQRRHGRAELLEDLDGAVHHVFNGFLLKFILAALVKRYWMDPADPAEHGFSPANTVSFMYAYSVYLFCDFAGYSCFAVGVSYLLGIHTPENFNRPFLARNIRDFWNRWHMTLTSWLRDHVYMRFLLAATKGGWFKSKQTASYLGIFIAFTLMGVWHGLELNYVLYGVYHASLMVGHEVFQRWNKDRRLWGEGSWWRAAGVVLTFHLVCLGFLLFSGRLGR
jgi:membrane protein involved in D-alanine export